MLDKFDGAASALKNKSYDKVKTVLEEGTGIVSKRIKAIKVTMHLQGCLACKRCSASGLNCRYLNPYIKLKLIGLAIRLYPKFWKK